MLARPCVFVLGNHSSGKSTFINHVLGRKVQTTGVAPTDDGFTVIASGSNDLEQDGPALISDPDLGFSSLRQFGHTLVSHVQLKVRKGLGLRGVFVIDSPGMIDSPMSTAQLAAAAPSAESHLAISMAQQEGSAGTGSAAAAPGLGGYSGAGVNTNANPRDRGYNFPAVVRWFAVRADVILLFFDPDKPGTTGETLAAMRTALAGMEHKMLIVLNKADQFDRVHDFARSYGSLCWNLSKVIPRKDLPPLFTMCVPTNTGLQGGDEAARHRASAGGLASMPETMAELESNREQVVAEVFRAPARRADNLVSRLQDSASLLLMHTRVLAAIQRESARQRSAWVGGAVSAALAGLGAAGALTMLQGAGLAAAVPVGVVGVGAAAGCLAMASRQTVALQSKLLSAGGGGLDDVFRREHFRALAEGDDSVASLWTRARPQVIQAISTLGLWQLPKVSAGQLAELERISTHEVATLRRQAGVAARAIEEDLGLPEGSRLDPEDGTSERA